jgi:sensor histidine kinase regulating citrate/malate metabolism
VSFIDVVLDVFISLIPPILMGMLVYLLFRTIFRADQRARDAYQQIEAEERAKLAAERSAKANSEQP